MNLQVLQVLTQWFERTELILRREKTRMNIDDTNELDKSLRHEVHQRSKDLLVGELEFLVRGRFQDMGVGKGTRKIETRAGNSELLQGNRRRPRKWYSRAFWGRLNDLQGVLGYRLMESAISTIKDPLDFLGRGNIGNPRI